MKFLSGNLFRRNVVEEMQTDSADDCQVDSKLKLITCKNQIISKKITQTVQNKNPNLSVTRI